MATIGGATYVSPLVAIMALVISGKPRVDMVPNHRRRSPSKLFLRFALVESALVDDDTNMIRSFSPHALREDVNKPFIFFLGTFRVVIFHHDVIVFAHRKTSRLEFHQTYFALRTITDISHHTNSSSFVSVHPQSQNALLSSLRTRTAPLFRCFRFLSPHQLHSLSIWSKFNGIEMDQKSSLAGPSSDSHFPNPILNTS
jgi:hypothetical protein